MNVAVMKTKAEQGFVEQFERTADQLPGDALVKAARKAAIGRFSAVGLPHRRVEEWKYTDLRAALKEALPADVEADLSAADLASALGPHLAALPAVTVVFVNGRFSEALSRFDASRGSTYHFDPTSTGFDATSSDWSWLKNRLADGGGAKSEAVVALNTALARDGAMLRVEAGKTITTPFHFVFVSNSAKPAAEFTRNFFSIGAGAVATLIESHVAVGQAARQTNSVAEIAVHEGARLAHIKTVSGSANAHVATALVDIAGEAAYAGFQFTAETAFVRNQSFVTFKGEDAKLDLSGVFLTRGREHVDTTLVVDHAVPHCESRELFRGVLDDQSRGIFQGKIIVRPDAQKTDGKQMAQALMLSPDAEFDSKPELEIYADDVVCGHGATCMELDEGLLFYFRSRGIPKDEARALLIASFAAEAIDKVEHEGIRSALMAMAEAWLKSAKA